LDDAITVWLASPCRAATGEKRTITALNVDINPNACIYPAFYSLHYESKAEENPAV
jgi:hypothetical protein